jgi:FKBP-type peptidyl-prolyl cis-trans isomerase
MFDDRNRTFAGLGLTCEGPTTFDLLVVNGSGDVLDKVAVCGTVSRVGTNYSNSSAIHVEVEADAVEDKKTTTVAVKEPVSSKKRKLDAAKQAKDLLDELRERQEADNNNGNGTSKKAKKSKKAIQQDTKVEAQPEKDIDDDKEDAPAPPAQPLTKQQRRKLAKQKSKELEEAVSTLMGHAAKGSRVLSKKKKAVLPSNKERRLAGGVVVQDVILGQGTVVQTGRKVGICYEGRLKEDGTVFDRNRNKKAPLSFRPGTGQVVAGLERGIEGMRVGGEREITIPPELGYGRKGSGAVIPADATLVFTVQLLSSGNE